MGKSKRFNVSATGDLPPEWLVDACTKAGCHLRGKEIAKRWAHVGMMHAAVNECERIKYEATILANRMAQQMNS